MWRPLFQSNELYEEINHVLGKFGTPFLALFEVNSPHNSFAYAVPGGKRLNVELTIGIG